VYGAAKGLIERYVQGMQHRFARTPLRVCLVKPGPTLTPMTAHLLESSLRLADASAVAASIVSGMKKNKAVIYAPPHWALIMRVLRSLPAALFNRLDL
jgi:short-subunit dehydrogenase